jgi:hypothetical protein
MLAAIVLLESPHGIYFDGFKARGHDMCILYLLHGCDNMINWLTNEAKLALLLFLPMVLKLGCQAD